MNDTSGLLCEALAATVRHSLTSLPMSTGCCRDVFGRSGLALRPPNAHGRYEFRTNTHTHTRTKAQQSRESRHKTHTRTATRAHAHTHAHTNTEKDARGCAGKGTNRTGPSNWTRYRNFDHWPGQLLLAARTARLNWEGALGRPGQFAELAAVCFDVRLRLVWCGGYGGLCGGLLLCSRSLSRSIRTTQHTHTLAY